MSLKMREHQKSLSETYFIGAQSLTDKTTYELDMSYDFVYKEERDKIVQY